MFSFPNKDRRVDWVNDIVLATERSRLKEGKGAELLSQNSGSGAWRSHWGTENTNTTGAFDTFEYNPSATVVSSLETISLGSSTNEFLNDGEASLSLEINESGVGVNNPQFEHTETGIIRSLREERITGGVLLGGVVLGGVILAEREQDQEKVMGYGTEPDGGLDHASFHPNQDFYSETTSCHVAVDRSASMSASKGGNIVEPSTYLRKYYDMMYYFGISAYKPKGENRKQHFVFVSLAIIQKVIFWHVAIISLFQSVSSVKYFYMDVISDGGYKDYMLLAFQLAGLLVKVCAVNIFWFKKEKTERMLDAMETYENVCGFRRGTTHGQFWKCKLVVLLAISTLLLAGVKVADFGAMGIEDLLLDGSSQLRQDIFVWNTKKNTSAEMDMEYGRTNLTVYAAVLGSIAIQRDTASYLQVGMVFDLIVLIGVVIYQYTNTFMKEVKMVTENVPKEKARQWNILQAEREKTWRKYRKIKAVIAEVNDIFDPMYKVLHVRNLLTYATFMASIIFGTAPLHALGLYSNILVKAEVGYLIAGRIAKVNDVIRTWIRNWAWNTGKIRIGNEEIDAGMILDELDKEPVGIGKGKFLIHETLHYKFIGLVGSVFFSMVDVENQQKSSSS